MALDPHDSTLAAKIYYYAAALTLGAIASFSALLGAKDRDMTVRGICAYVITGGLCGLMIVLFLVERYGPSELLIGVSILAGYQAFNVFFIFGAALSRGLRYLVEDRLKIRLDRQGDYPSYYEDDARPEEKDER